MAGQAVRMAYFTINRNVIWRWNWNWPDWRLPNILRLGATFTTINGYIEGRLADDTGAELLIKSATKV